MGISFGQSTRNLGPRGGGAALAVELPRADRGGHVGGFLAVHRAVVELDHGQQALATETLYVLATTARQRRLLDHLVLDALLVERLLHLETVVEVGVQEREGTAVQLDGHLAPLCRGTEPNASPLPRVLPSSSARRDTGGPCRRRTSSWLIEPMRPFGRVTWTSGSPTSIPRSNSTRRRWKDRSVGTRACGSGRPACLPRFPTGSRPSWRHGTLATEC